MDILVTGGAGFIGSHLVKALLKRGDKVFVVDNLSTGKKENVPDAAVFLHGDILEIETIPGLPKFIDQIFHLAAQIDVRKSVDDPDFNNRVNIDGTKKVIDYGVGAGMSKLIFSSTGGAIYGPAELIPTPEESPCLSSSPYGTSKYEAEKLILNSAQRDDFTPVILRYANVYGPGQGGSKETGVIAIFTQNAFEKKPSVIYGDGEQTRDFVFVDDVVWANVFASEQNISGIYNIGTGIETSINQLAELLKEAGGGDLVFTKAAFREGEELRSCLEIQKIQDLGWSPKTSLREGIAKTLASLK